MEIKRDWRWQCVEWWGNSPVSPCSTYVYIYWSIFCYPRPSTSYVCANLSMFLWLNVCACMYVKYLGKFETFSWVLAVVVNIIWRLCVCVFVYLIVRVLSIRWQVRHEWTRVYNSRNCYDMTQEILFPSFVGLSFVGPSCSYVHLVSYKTVVSNRRMR